MLDYHLLLSVLKTIFKKVTFSLAIDRSLSQRGHRNAIRDFGSHKNRKFKSQENTFELVKLMHSQTLCNFTCFDIECFHFSP